MVENTNLKNSVVFKKHMEYEEWWERNQEEDNITYHSVNIFPHILMHYLAWITQFPKKTQ